MNDCDELDLEDLFSGRIDKRELEFYAKEYENQVMGERQSDAVLFRYCIALTKSNKENIRKGIELLEKFLNISTEYSKERIIIQLVIAHTRLKEYDRALAYLNVVKQAQSNAACATEMENIIKNRMRNADSVGCKGKALPNRSDTM
ncbi:unnamed protein product [Dracunculus medinensis]|uniref:TPR_REGION domain-containing protein n=1 Tax=Dracunculus medinensis TaxID=318479 RepID=A0A0N4U6A2_DRAME|nr:unnamed protein product [Dracunculus medinensis]